VLRELRRLRVEIEELRAARRRLVLAADDDRRSIERELHGGVLQQLVALAVSLQLAGQAADSDPEAAKTLLDEMGRDVQQALDEATLLAQRIYPAALRSDGLAAMLRVAAVTAGVPAHVDVAAGSDYSSEVVMTIYLCWLDTLAHEPGESRMTISVHESEDGLAFEVTASRARSDHLGRLQDRVEALDGRLTIGTGPDGSTRISGFLPPSR
jgi:signal transduction histidine kinase